MIIYSLHSPQPGSGNKPGLGLSKRKNKKVAIGGEQRPESEPKNKKLQIVSLTPVGGSGIGRGWPNLRV